jgi:hypothetical protein
MSVYARLRLDIKRERVEIKGVETEVEEKTQELPGKAAYGSVFAISGPSSFPRGLTGCRGSR